MIVDAILPIERRREHALPLALSLHELSIDGRSIDEVAALDYTYAPRRTVNMYRLHSHIITASIAMFGAFKAIHFRSSMIVL